MSDDTTKKIESFTAKLNALAPEAKMVSDSIRIASIDIHRYVEDVLKQMGVAHIHGDSCCNIPGAGYITRTFSWVFGPYIKEWSDGEHFERCGLYIHERKTKNRADAPTEYVSTQDYSPANAPLEILPYMVDGLPQFLEFATDAVERTIDCRAKTVKRLDAMAKETNAALLELQTILRKA